MEFIAIAIHHSRHWTKVLAHFGFVFSQGLFLFFRSCSKLCLQRFRPLQFLLAAPLHPHPKDDASVNLIPGAYLL